jgi:hypothetical protein
MARSLNAFVTAAAAVLEAARAVAVASSDHNERTRLASESAAKLSEATAAYDAAVNEFNGIASEARTGLDISAAYTPPGPPAVTVPVADVAPPVPPPAPVPPVEPAPVAVQPGPVFPPDPPPVPPVTDAAPMPELPPAPEPPAPATPDPTFSAPPLVVTDPLMGETFTLVIPGTPAPPPPPIGPLDNIDAPAAVTIEPAPAAPLPILPEEPPGFANGVDLRAPDDPGRIADEQARLAAEEPPKGGVLNEDGSVTPQPQS